MPSIPTHESLVRQLHLLQLIPRSPAQVTVSALTAELARLGYSVTSRTVQRDLQDLARVMPLECNDKSKPYGWKWARDTRMQLPLMSLQEGLTLHLVNQHLKNSLPPSLLVDLLPLFKQAEQIIKGLGSQNQVTHWLESVVVVPPTQPLLAPRVSTDVQQAVYQAVFEQRPIEVMYRSINQDEPKMMVLHPLGLIHRGVVTYLGATVNDYDSIRLFALHRFISVKILHLEQAQPKNKQSWQDYIAHDAGGFSVDSQSPITLEAWVSEDLAAYLQETPLSQDQSITLIEDGYKLRATVYQTWQLFWWILSQGSRIVVQSPQQLKDDLKEEILSMYQCYFD